MEKTHIIYKGEKYELDEYRLQTRIINNQEKRLIYVKFRGKEFEGETLPQVKSWLERMIKEEKNLNS